MVAARLFDPALGRQRVERYELIGEIASGGMATVYLARLTGMGGFQRFVAMKRLHPHLASEAEFVQMFLDEARVAARIHHPNVVPILEVGASLVGYYLVMEYVEGDTLARLLARAGSVGRKVPPAITMRIGLDMLNGLHAAHELHEDDGRPIELVHRDVSPQNILVGSDGIARITDFGVARAATRLSGTRVGQLKGKIAYMAPEQAHGDERLDRRADVFAAGIVLWEALTGKRLFKADTEAATLSRVMTERIPALAESAPEVGRPVSDVIAQALSRDPRHRFSTCAAFADALETAASYGPRVASSRDLSSYVEEVMGEEIARQREAVRIWLSRTESIPPQSSRLVSSMPPSSSVSAAAVSLPQATGMMMGEVTVPDAPRRSRWAMAGLFLLLLAGSGLGGYFGVRLFRQGSPEVSPSAPGSAPAVIPAPAASSLPQQRPSSPEVPEPSSSAASETPVYAAPSGAGAAQVPSPAGTLTRPGPARLPNPALPNPAATPLPNSVPQSPGAPIRPRKKKSAEGDELPENPYR